jgi:hypothetical protein
MKKKKVFKYRGYDVTISFGALNNIITQDMVDGSVFQNVLNQSVGKVIDKRIRKEKLERLKNINNLL